MTNAKCCDEDSPFLWRYRSRLQPEHYPGPVYDAHLTDWAPTYDDHAVFYLDINRSEQAWTPVLNHVSRQVEQKVTLNWNLPETDKTYQAIAQLVPWTINRIQIARTPKARRLPLDIPVTHRACVLVQNDGTVTFESDHLMSTPYCSSRFAKPVSVLIAGRSAPEGVTMGHAGALAHGNFGTFETKRAALEAAGARVFQTIDALIDALDRDIGGQQ